MYLQYQDGRRAKIGDQIKTFRGDKVILIGWTEPHKPSSTGRVLVVWPDGYQQELFPSVINAEWKNR